MTQNAKYFPHVNKFALIGNVPELFTNYLSKNNIIIIVKTYDC